MRRRRRKKKHLTQLLSAIGKCNLPKNSHLTSQKIPNIFPTTTFRNPSRTNCGNPDGTKELRHSETQEKAKTAAKAARATFNAK